MRFSKNLGTHLVLLVLASLCLSFTYVVEENCEEVVTPFRAVSKDGGHGDGYYAHACPEEELRTSFTVSIYAPGTSRDPNTCPWPLYLYAHLNSGTFADMLGVSEPILSWTEYEFDPGYFWSRPSLAFSFTAYEDLLCTNGGQNVNVTARFVLAYWHNGSFHELVACPDLFPSDDFPNQDLSHTRLIDLDCGCNDPAQINSDNSFPGGSSKGSGTKSGGSYVPGSGPASDISDNPLQSQISLTQSISDQNQQTIDIEKQQVHDIQTIKLYPNPFRESINLQFFSENEDRVSFTVYDSKGKAVLRNFIQTQKGDQSYVLPLTNLASGLYWVQLHIAGEMRSFKVLKM